MMCLHGAHEFPYEDARGAHCPEHGVTMLFHGAPMRRDGLPPRPSVSPEWAEWLDLGPDGPV